MCKVFSSSIRTLPSAPESHRISHMKRLVGLKCLRHLSLPVGIFTLPRRFKTLLYCYYTVFIYFLSIIFFNYFEFTSYSSPATRHCRYHLPINNRSIRYSGSWAFLIFSWTAEILYSNLNNLTVMLSVS